MNMMHVIYLNLYNYKLIICIAEDGCRCLLSKQFIFIQNELFDYQRRRIILHSYAFHLINKIFRHKYFDFLFIMIFVY